MPAGKLTKVYTAPTIKKIVRKEINKATETKHYLYDQDYTAIPNGTAGDQTNLTENIVRGTSDSTRIGDRINVTKVFGQFYFKIDDNPANPTDSIRVLLCQSKGGPISAISQAFYEYADLDKMHVLKDFLVTVNGQYYDSGSAYVKGGVVKRLTIKHKFKTPLSVSYDETLGIRNQLYLYVVGDNNCSKYAGHIEVYFKDP